MKRTNMRLLPILSAVLLSLTACQKTKPAAETATPSEQQTPAKKAAGAPQSIQQQWTYLNRIRQRDAFDSSIARTLLDEQNELGVVLFLSVTPDKVPALMRTVMTDMAQEFPRQDVILNVYEFADPLRKIGTARLDGQTGQVTYIPKK